MSATEYMDKLLSTVTGDAATLSAYQTVGVAAVAGILVIGIMYLVSAQCYSGGLGQRASFLNPVSGVDDVAEKAEKYTKMHDEGGGSEAMRAENNEEMVNQYYDLVTLFYEAGWGSSFHFAPRWVGETFEASLIRHEHFVGMQAGAGKGKRILDVGCGVGGPARNIARVSQAHVVGLNNNAYQCRRGDAWSKVENLSGLVSFVNGSFLGMPFEDEEFDGAYEIEATCHAANRVQCYSEIFRVLKPGAAFAGYEWCMVEDWYNPEDAEHKSIKAGIEIGDGLPNILYRHEIIEALEESGFVVEEEQDLAEAGNPKAQGAKSGEDGPTVPWFDVFRPSFVNSFRAAKTLLAGGERNIFTPCYYFRARKPLDAKAPVKSTSKGQNDDEDTRARAGSRVRSQ